MKIIKHLDCESFLAHNEELLVQNESFYNLMLGLAYGIRSKNFETNNPLFYSITDGQKIISCALRSKVYQFIYRFRKSYFYFYF